MAQRPAIRNLELTSHNRAPRKRQGHVIWLLLLLLVGSVGCGSSSSSGSATPTAAAHEISAADVQKQIQVAGAQWTADETSVSQQRTDDEFKTMCGFPNAEVVATATVLPTATEPLPTKFSWRSKDGVDWMTPVADQGGYGTCVAFATIGSLEPRIRIADNAPTKNLGLSEWHIFFLGFGDLVAGWHATFAAETLQKTGTIDRASCPYSQAPGHTETASKSFVWKTTGYRQSYGREPMKRAILAGPVVGVLRVYQDFMYYAGGIYKKTTGRDVGSHAVVLVGWDDDNKCWIARNSWSSSWGEKGYFRILYGECNVEGYGCWSLDVAPARPDPNQSPARPSIISPTANATTSTNPTISASVFSDPDRDAHDSSTWEIYDNSSLAANRLVWSRAGEKLKKTSIPVTSENGTFANSLSGKTSLALRTTYYVRVKYADHRGASSEFSPVVPFATVDGPNTAPAAPSITGPLTGSTGNAINPTLVSNAFSDIDGDAHASATWEVYDSASLSAGSLVWSSPNDEANKTTILVHSFTGSFANALSGKTSLAFSKTYFARVRYTDARGAASAFSSTVSFTTVLPPNTVPSKPSIASPVSGAANLAVNPTIAGSAFVDPDGDLHGSSVWEIYDGASGSLVWSTPNDTVNKTGILVNASNGMFSNALAGRTSLSFNTPYSVRVKYVDARGGASPFSNSNGFTTGAAPNSPPARPSLTSPTAGATNTLVNPTLQASVFIDPDGDTHATTTWEVYDNAGLLAGNLVWSKSGDTINLASITVNTTSGNFTNALAGKTSLDATTTYHARVRDTDSRGAASSFSTVVTFTTSPNAWARTFGGTGGESAQAIARTNDGGYVIAAYTDSFGAGQRDVLVMRLRADGTLIWANAYGGSGNDAPQSVSVAADGTFLVACSTDSFGAGNTDLWLLKLNGEGSVAFQKTYGGAQFDARVWLGAQSTSDGGYIVATDTSSAGAGSDDLWVLKLDGDGNPTAQKVYGTATQELGAAISQTANGGYVVSGGTDAAGFGVGDAWVVRLNSDLSIAWQKAFGGTATDLILGAVKETSTGDLIVPAITTSFGPTPGRSNFWPILLDANGTVKFQKVIGDDGVDTVLGVEVDGAGSFILAGVTDLLGGSGDDVWVVKLSPTGGVLSQRGYGGVGSDVGRGSTLASDGSLVIAGLTDSFGAGGHDVFAMKLNLDGTIPNFGTNSSWVIQDTAVIPANTSVGVANTSVVGVTTSCTVTAVSPTVAQQAP